MMAFECMEDCIHLKACRRIQAIGRKHRLMVPRYCTEDCTAYVSGSNNYFLTADEAASVARRNYDGSGDSYDVYCSWDFPSRPLKDIIDELEETDRGAGGFGSTGR